MIIKTIYVILCVYCVNGCCKDVIKINIDEDNKGKDSVELSIEKNFKLVISNQKNYSGENVIPKISISGSREKHILNDSPKHRNPNINKIYHYNANNDKKGSKSTWAEGVNDNVYRETIQTKPRDVSSYNEELETGSKDDSLYHENMQRIPLNRDNISHKKKLTTITDDYEKIQKERRNRKPRTTPPDDIISQEKIHRVSRDDNLYHKTLRHENIYHGRVETVPNEGGLHYEEMPTQPVSDELEKFRRSPCEGDFYHDKIQKISLNNYDHLRNMRLEPSDDDIYYRGKMQSVNGNKNDLDLLAARNSTIEVSDHDYQGSKNTEESDERDSLVDYPYSVSIQRKGAHYASGALVGERWVLSTAAEFHNVRETIKLYRMRVGSANCKRGGVVVPLQTIAIHPDFVPGKPSFDIAVLRMAQPVRFSSMVKPIGLSRVAGKVMSAKFLTTYWPRIVVKKGVIPPSANERVRFSSMRVSTQALVSSDLCKKLLAEVNVTLDRSSLCLKAVKAHHSDCMPDAGAPVVAVDGLWGITSGWVSPVCPYKPLPTVFTRVSSPNLRTWINGQLAL